MGRNKKTRIARAAVTLATPQDYKRVVLIKGMHCSSCELLIADELEGIHGVTNAHVSLKDKSATIYSTEYLSDSIIEKAINNAGYEVGRDYGDRPFLSRNPRIWKDFGAGLLLILAIYVLFRGFGLDQAIAGINATGGGNGTMALIIGITAGFSTCMALIGGLVLSVASKYAESHPNQTALQKFKPHLFFNLGRIASFIVLGALIGVLGSAFALKGSLLGFLTIVVGIVMLVLGLQLTELFPRLTRGLTLPSGLAKKLGISTRANSEYSHKNALLMGAATFFLPCGFTQAMQLLAVSTGSPVQAAIIMGAFAIGTTPGLLSLGGLTSVVKGSFARRFFRVVGVAVVAMSVWNLANGYTLMGLKFSLADILPKQAPVSQQVASDTTTAAATTSTDGSAILATTYRLSSDISPSTFTAKVGQKTTLLVDVKDNGSGCMSTIMIIGLDDTPQYLRKGKKLELTFTPTQAGKYTIACAMGIPRGSITVTQ